MRSISFFLAAAFAALGVPAAHAELPAPRLDRLTPLGGGAGQSVEVEVQGSDLGEVKALLFDHPGLTAAPVEGKERRWKVTIAGDVPAGTYDVRTVGSYGVSSPRLFAVSRDLAEIAETEPNNEPGQAQRVEVNSVVQGNSDGNGEDLFRLPLKAGQRVTIACESGKLDTAMDANLALTTLDGKPLAASGDYYGRDPLLDFVAPADDEYLVSVSDLSFRGGYPYRLVVSDRPHLEGLFPRAVQTGRSTELTATGQNLSGRPVAAAAGGDLPFDEFRFAVTPPDEIFALGAYRFLEHPTDHSVLPTAATCTLTGWQAAALLAGRPTNPLNLLVTDHSVALDAEPNDDRERPQTVSLPLVLAGRFDRPRDADWFEFEVPKSGSYQCDVYCERIAGRGDPFVAIFDDAGKRVTELDDAGIRQQAFDGHLRDPAGTINLTEKRKYRALVQDRYGRGGPRYQYVFALVPAVPDFYVAAIHSQNPGPAGCNLWRGGAAYLDVIVHHRGGSNGPVTLTAENLPPGVHARPSTVANNSQGVFVLWADADAPEGVGRVKLVAEGRDGERTFRREVRVYTRVASDLNSSRPTRELAVGVVQAAPFALQFSAERIVLKPGEKQTLKLTLERRWPEHKDELNVLPTAWPGQLKVQLGKFAGDQQELEVTFEADPNLRPGDYTLAVLGQGQVPFAKDPKKPTEKANTLVTLPSRPLTVHVEAAEAK